MRFLNADSIIETENLFAYCNNDSINCSDETGEATINEVQTRIWKRPSEKSDLADKLKKGTKVTVLFSVYKDDVLWCYISYNRGSNKGYVKGSKLSDTTMEFLKPGQMDVYSLFGPKKKDLKWGSTGVYVYNMQVVLYSLGFLVSINDCDGIYGPTTKKALEDFQSANYLRCDGLCGEETKKTMMKEKLRNHNHELVDNTSFSNMVIYH